MKTKYLFRCVILAISLHTGFTANTQAVNIQDSLALVDLYNSTNGPGWGNHTNWLIGPVNTWFGITVNENRVTRISLTFNNLYGKLPSSLGNISDLTYLDFNGNYRLGGSTIPASIGNLEKLDLLRLSQCQLTGSIPQELGNLTKLTWLDLSNNQLSGNISGNLGMLTNLQTLSFGNNQLSGTIPPELGNLTNVTFFNLSYNQLTGSIPPELGNLTLLRTLLLYRNQLSGNIPPELGKLINLSSLDLSNNQLTGNIPAELGNLVNLYGFIGFNLSYNKLSGSIPPSLGNFVRLYGTFDLSNNSLIGSIPPELGNIAKNGLYYIRIFLNNNQLSGNIPPELGNIAIMSELHLNDNLLSGSIPAELSNLSNLTYLNVRNNKLNGKLTNTISKLTKLKYLYVDHNRLTGTIPDHITTLPLDSLNLSDNRFTFDGMELVAQTFPFAKYNDQARIHVEQKGNTLSISAGGTLSNNTYEWHLLRNPGNITITGDSVFHPAKSGMYRVKVYNSIASQLVIKSDTILFIAPDAMTTAEAQSDIVANTFTAYPNPVKNILNIRTTGNVSVTLVDQNGKILLTMMINTNGTMNVSGITPGLYYLRNNITGEREKIIIIK